MKKILLAIVCLMCLGCGEDSTIPHNNKREYYLPKGMKLVNVTAQRFSIRGVVYRKMEKGEKAQTYYFEYLNGPSDVMTIIEQEEK